MLQRTSQKLLTVIFLLLIFAPMAIMLTTERAEISVHEKRRLASPPEWHWDSRLLTEFPQKFSDFFNDHYGLREKLVERSQRLKKKYLKKSPTWMVVRGHEDWLFVDRRGSLRDYIGLEQLDDETLNNWQQQLIDKKDWLQSAGIQYYFVPVPNKITLYGQYLPPRIRDYSGVTRLDQILAYLQAQGLFNRYTNLEPILFSHQGRHPDAPLYFKSDSHWNSHGAFVAYRHIMKQLVQILPQLEPPLAMEQMVRKHRTHDGDLANIVDLGRQRGEQTYDLVPRERCASETNYFLSNLDQTGANDLNNKMLPEYNGCETRKLSAVIVHDSFGAYLKPFFAESFRRAIFVGNRAQEKLKSILETEKPDLLLEITIERNLLSRMIIMPSLTGQEN